MAASRPSSPLDFPEGGAALALQWDHGAHCERKDGRMDEQMVEEMGGWMDGRMDRLLDGWAEG